MADWHRKHGVGDYYPALGREIWNILAENIWRHGEKWETGQELFQAAKSGVGSERCSEKAVESSKVDFRKPHITRHSDSESIVNRKRRKEKVQRYEEWADRIIGKIRKKME